MRRRQSVLIGMMFASLLATQAQALDDSPGADRAEIVERDKLSRGLKAKDQTVSRHRAKQANKKQSRKVVKNRKKRQQAKLRDRKHRHYAKVKRRGRSNGYHANGYRDTHDDYALTVDLHAHGHQRQHQYTTIPEFQESHHYNDGYDTSYGSDNGHDYHDSDVSYVLARVVDVEPIVTFVDVETPQRRCWQEPVRRYYTENRHNSIAPTILGGILGGVVGNQFGGGSGKDLLTVGGVLLGASVGYDVSHHQHNRGYTTQVETRCEVNYHHHQEQRTDGYRVTYVYNGQTYVKRVNHAPGRHIKVQVQLTPLI